MIFIFAAALVASAIADAGATPREPLSDALAECQVVGEGPSSFALVCPNASLNVRERAQPGGGEFVRGIASGFTMSAPQPVEHENGHIDISGVAHAVTRLRASDGRVLVIASEDRAPKFRVVTCQSNPGTSHTCERLVARTWTWNASDGPPKSIPRNLEKVLAGRRITAPQGCEASGAGGAGSLDCDDGTSLAWVPLEGRKGLLEGWLANFRGKGLVERVEPCDVEGVETDCHVLRNPAGGPPALTAAQLRARGALVLVVCSDMRPNPGVPPVCSQVMSLSAPRSQGAGTREGGGKQ